MSPGAEMFRYYAENADPSTTDRDLTKVRELNPALKSFVDRLTQQKDELKSA